MNSNPDELNELQKVLALKRHEQPPTQFFRSLSGNVIERLQTGEAPAEPTWRQKAGLDFDAKPVLVCATGVGVCGLLLLGLISSQHVELPAVATTQAETSQMPLVPLAHPSPSVPGAAQILPAEDTRPQRRSTDPVIVGERSLLKPLAAPAQETLPAPGGGGQK
jgi:hypothetical protein